MKIIYNKLPVRIKLRCAVLFSCFFAVINLSGATFQDSTWGINGELMGYVENIEYSNRFRDGQTILGAWLKSRILYKPVKGFSFSAGFFGNRYFGDSCFFTIIRPLLGAQFNTDHFLFAIGEIETPVEYDFPDILFRKEFRFQPGSFEGLSLKAGNSFFEQNNWIQWYALNTPSQREHFAFGNSSRFIVNPVSIFLSAIIDHHGGEQFAPENDPIRENYCSALGADINLFYSGFIKQFHGRILGSFSATRNRSESHHYKNGWGVLGLAEVAFKYLDIGFQVFRGDSLIALLGNPVYQTNKPYYSLIFSKNYKNRFVEVDGGLNLEVADVEFQNYFKKFQHRWWISLLCRYESFFRFHK
ncbi:MAG: hypothetical protein GX640_07700 [Fibrobacter sp.]|nr:hypothetical protein [Fibrobacter sp.]